MRKIDFGQALGILANIGVIAGIVFLAIEINQGNQLARAQTRSEVTASIASFLELLTSDAELSEMYLRAVEDPEAVTQAESDRIFWLLAWRMRVWENVHFQYRNGLFDEDEFAVEREVWRVDVNEPLFHDFHCSTRQQFSGAFMAEIEDLMFSTQC